MTNPVQVAVSAKGMRALVSRVGMIGRRYGPTPAKMDRALALFARILKQFDCNATFPTTAVAVKRHPEIWKKYQDQGIEFAVHGYTHVDYAQLTSEEQLEHLRRAQEVFQTAGIAATGFRSPYLRREAHLNAAVQKAGYAYVSNQPVMWDVVDTGNLDPLSREHYERASAFYDAWPANERPVVPSRSGSLVEIPVSLPDDEILLDRLHGQESGLVAESWQRILSQTHQRGDLFTIQLHPERIALCAQDLVAVLSQARKLTPPVWLARLDQIANWWQARARAAVNIRELGSDQFQIEVTGPQGTLTLARGVQVHAPTVPWADRYCQVQATSFTIHAPCRPCIGVSPTTHPRLVDFVRQQGYIVETSAESGRFACYLDRREFPPEQELALLTLFEKNELPLVRLGRWPEGAHSALAITGDIDALTLWDYSLRFLGR